MSDQPLSPQPTVKLRLLLHYRYSNPRPDYTGNACIQPEGIVNSRTGCCSFKLWNHMHLSNVESELRACSKRTADTTTTLKSPPHPVWCEARQQAHLNPEEGCSIVCSHLRSQLLALKKKKKKLAFFKCGWQLMKESFLDLFDKEVHSLNKIMKRFIFCS